MNAKELRTAATRLLRGATKALAFPEKLTPNVKAMLSDTCTVAQDCLARVKEDDDEPITEEHLAREPVFKYDYSADGYVLNNNNQSIFAKIKTRGQLRRLLEVLGVEE